MYDVGFIDRQYAVVGNMKGWREDPEVWEKQIRAFEKQERKQAPPTRSVVFVGSSTIRLWTALGQRLRGRGRAGFARP